MELSQMVRELKEIAVVFGVGVPLVFGAVVGLNYPNVKRQIDAVYPVIEHNLTLTKEAVKDKKYDEAEKLTEQTISLWQSFSLHTGMYEIFWKKGRQINAMHRETCEIKKSLENLGQYSRNN